MTFFEAPHAKPIEPVFASAFLYAACKNVGDAKWPDYLAEQLAKPAESQWPAIRTLASELAAVCSPYLWWDATTYIDRARCVAAGHFLASGHDVWLTCDDDVFAEDQVLRAMIRACRMTRGAVALPYANRDGKSMTFRRVSGPTVWLPLGDEQNTCWPVRTVDRIGFGLVAMHRELIETLARDAVWFKENETSGVLCPHLFANDVEDGGFIGEDYAFCRRCERIGRSVRVLLEAECEHAGILTMLDHDGQIVVADPAYEEILKRSVRARDEWALSGQTAQTKGA
jgi:hypothetical protein